MLQLLVRSCLAQTISALLILIFPILAHYSRYFRLAEGSDPGERDIIFDWAALREACISFLDSIVIELCFPRAPYPKVVLYQILRDAVAESPKEAKRFPQALWDAVGDLSAGASFSRVHTCLLTILPVFRFRFNFNNYWEHHYLALKVMLGKAPLAPQCLRVMTLGLMLSLTPRRRLGSTLISRTSFFLLTRPKTNLSSRICGSMSTL